VTPEQIVANSSQKELEARPNYWLGVYSSLVAHSIAGSADADLARVWHRRFLRSAACSEGLAVELRRIGK
jgi:hypothetical protein